MICGFGAVKLNKLWYGRVNVLTFNTAGDKELGPLDEKYATLGDFHLPITDFALPSFTTGDLHSLQETNDIMHIYS